MTFLPAVRRWVVGLLSTLVVAVGVPVVLSLPADAAATTHITTIVGSMGEGQALNVGQSPVGLAAFGARLYVADSKWNVVRAVELGTGEERVVAGHGPISLFGEFVADDAGDGAPATRARLRQPAGIAVDGDGSLFIAEAGAHRVRKVNPDGIISTVAGNGTAGFFGDGLPSTFAQLSAPTAVATDPLGNVFISDQGNGRVRRIDASGVITTVLEVPGALPGALAADSSGSVFVALHLSSPKDTRPRTVKVSPSGEVSPVTAGGQPLETTALAIDASDDLYVVSDGVRKLTRSGALGPALPECPAPADRASRALAVGPDGSVYAGADTAVCRTSASGPAVVVAGHATSEFGGDGGPARKAQVVPGPLAYAPDGALYVATGYPSRILRIDTTGRMTTVAGGGPAPTTPDGAPATSGTLGSVAGLALDALGDVLFSEDARVRRIDAGGIVRTVAGNGESGYAGDGLPAVQARLNAPGYLAVAGDGTIYIGDRLNNRIRRVNPAGVISTFAGNGAFQPSGDSGPATAAGLPFPSGMSVDASGAVFIGSSGLIRMVDASGTITSVAGTGTFGYNGDGPALATQLQPGDLGFSSDGTLVFTDRANHLVRKLSSGLVTTIAGNRSPGHTGDGGPALAAALYYPSFLAIDGADRIAVNSVDRVRQLRMPGLPGAPTAVSALARAASAHVTWRAPLDDGAASITSSTVTASPSGATVVVGGQATSADVPGLPNGVAQTFTVRATNAVGPGPSSAPSAAVAPSDGLGFHPLPPARILDSRPPPNQVGEHLTPWSAGQARDVTVTDVGGVPAGAAAVTLNVTVTDTTAGGYLTIWPAGQPQPLASSLNWAPGQTIPNAVTVKVGAGGKVSVLNPVGRANVIADVVGYYDTLPGDGLTPLTPARIIDSRPAPSTVGTYSTPWGPNQTRDITVAGAGGVPAGADAVVVNVTVTGTTAAGYLTIWPAGQPQPLASSLNWAPGQTIPNAVTVKVGAGGRISVFNAGGAADVIIDVVGSFSPGTGHRFHPLSPARIQDSRPGGPQVGPYSTPWGADTARGVQVIDAGGVPADASAVLMNVTATATTASSYLTVWRAGQVAPLASSLNWAAGDTIPNSVTAELGASGGLSVRNALGQAHVIADVAGWYG